MCDHKAKLELHFPFLFRSYLHNTGVLHIIPVSCEQIHFLNSSEIRHFLHKFSTHIFSKKFRHLLTFFGNFGLRRAIGHN